MIKIIEMVNIIKLIFKMIKIIFKMIKLFLNYINNWLVQINVVNIKYRLYSHMPIRLSDLMSIVNKDWSGVYHDFRPHLIIRHCRISATLLTRE